MIEISGAISAGKVISFACPSVRAEILFDEKQPILKHNMQRMQYTMISIYVKRTPHLIDENFTSDKGVIIIPMPELTEIINANTVNFNINKLTECFPNQNVDNNEKIGSYEFSIITDYGRQKQYVIKLNLDSLSEARYTVFMYGPMPEIDNNIYLYVPLAFTQTYNFITDNIVCEADERYTQIVSRRINKSTQMVYNYNFVAYIIGCKRILQNTDLKNIGIGIKFGDIATFLKNENSIIPKCIYVKNDKKEITFFAKLYSTKPTNIHFLL